MYLCCYNLQPSTTKYWHICFNKSWPPVTVRFNYLYIQLTNAFKFLQHISLFWLRSETQHHPFSNNKQTIVSSSHPAVMGVYLIATKWRGVDVWATIYCVLDSLYSSLVAMVTSCKRKTPNGCVQIPCILFVNGINFSTMTRSELFKNDFSVTTGHPWLMVDYFLIIFFNNSFHHIDVWPTETNLTK